MASAVTNLITINDTTNGSSGAKTYTSGTSAAPATNDQLVARVTVSSGVAITSSNISLSDSSSDGITWKLKDSAVGTNSSSLWIWTGVFVADKACSNATRTFSVAVTGLSGSNPSGCNASFDAVTGTKVYGDAAVVQTGHDSGNTAAHPSPNFAQAALTTSICLMAASDNYNTQNLSPPTSWTEQPAWFGHTTPAHCLECCHILSGFTGTTILTTGTGSGAFPWSAVSIELTIATSVVATGQSTTAQQGTAVAGTTVVASGQQTTTSQGAAVPTITVTATGIQLALQQGSPVAGVVAVPTGQSVTAQQGAPTVQVNVTVNGVQLQTQQGATTPSASASASGQATQVSQGVPVAGLTAVPLGAALTLLLGTPTFAVPWVPRSGRCGLRVVPDSMLGAFAANRVLMIAADNPLAVRADSALRIAPNGGDTLGVAACPS